MLEIGLRVPSCAPATEVAAFIERAEAAGFSAIAVPDTQVIARDPFITLALAAQRTARVVLNVAVANPITRHVSVLACLAQTVEELAPGRVRIILGRGDSAVKMVGLAGANLAEMRSTTTTLKRLLAREEVSLGGQRVRLAFASERRVPVYIAATGPLNMQLAGEIADGALVQVPNVAATRMMAYAQLQQGAGRGSRDPTSMDVIWGIVPAIVTHNMKEARARAHAYCASWVLMPDRARWLRAAGIELPVFTVPPELATVYPDIAHAEDPEEVRRLTPFLTEDLAARICDTMGLFGTPEHCARRLAQMAAEGVRKVFVRSMETYSLPEELLKAFETEVFPRLKKLLR